MSITRLWRNIAAAVVAIAALILAAASFAPEDTAGPCSVVQGPALLPEVGEASGLSLSRRIPGLLWTHNDSGNPPMLFAIDAAGTMRGRVRVPIERWGDWEDLAVGRCPSGDCLYIADIGDNSFARRRVQIYRVPEPDPRDAQTASPEVFNVSYPDGAHNAEALFVVESDLFVITRDRTGGLYRSAVDGTGSRELTLQRIGQLGLEVVTDAETSSDGAFVAVRTSDEVVFYRTADLIRGGSVQNGRRVPIGGLREPQGEGVALDANGTLYLASEGRPWNRAGRLLSLRCTGWLGS